MTQTNSSIGIRQLLDMQKQAFIEEGAVSAEVRMQRLQQLIQGGSSLQPLPTARC